MGRLKITEDGKNFTLDGRDFFYLADTVWSAFTNITLEEWRYYLEKRYTQGFTVLQINMLPQWDRCMTDVGIYPFKTEDGQVFDFTVRNEAYFERAQQMCRMAGEFGFQLALVVMWLNYVPGTWGSRITDRNVMPENLVQDYAEKAVEVFDQFDPIYVISGDTDFDTPEAVRYYGLVLDAVCRKSPEALKTFHIKRGYAYIPEEFLDRTDFLMYQSGHNAGEQEQAYLLPEKLAAKYPGKPLLNAEPCYEQMGYSRQEYGRFTRYDIRKAAWSSLLSGACAGVTYGAHGVWNWKKRGAGKNPVLGEGFDEAFPVEEALQFCGAWDYGYIRNFFEQNHIRQLRPCQEFIRNSPMEIRGAVTPDGRYLIYLPNMTRLVLTEKMKGLSGRIFDLETGRVARVRAEAGENGECVLLMPGFEKDMVVLLEE